ncbi:MAG TPA: zf-HC2 domain-containing protein [Acidimicrobiales bacterium]|jgi:anti-sigma factor RsiW|nr:zf-HC2 domain-containing protein [Acidimicrobiales bacterium]
MSGRFGTGSFGGPSPAGGQGHLGDALSALLDGELAGPQVGAAHSHLLGCERCAAELAAVSQARTWVRALPPAEPPFGFYERILLERVPLVVVQPAPVGGGSVRRRVALAAVGVAAAAVTVLGVGSPQQHPVVPSVPHLVEFHSTGTAANADVMSKLAPMAVPVSFGR